MNVKDNMYWMSKFICFLVLDLLMLSKLLQAFTFCTYRLCNKNTLLSVSSSLTFRDTNQHHTLFFSSELQHPLVDQTTRVGIDHGNHQYPWPSSTRGTNDVLQSHYIYHANTPIQHDDWEKLCPPTSEIIFQQRVPFFLPLPFDRKRRTTTKHHQHPPLDVTRIWSLQDDPREVAKEIVRACLSHVDDDGNNSNNGSNERMVDSLATSLEESLFSYREFCQTHLLPLLPEGDDNPKYNNNNNNNRCKLKCRLVASRGPTGAKCPQYHIDHVPVRWVQAMVGPGVEFVVVPTLGQNDNLDVDDDSGIRWDAFHQLSSNKDGHSDEDDEDDDPVTWSVQDRNKMLVDKDRATVCRAKEGEAVLMMGSRWKELTEPLDDGNIKVSSSSLPMKPVVHKSPEVSNSQARVLFTQDILFDFDTEH